MHGLWNFVIGVIGLATRFAVFVAIALVGGFGSAWVMIHSGSRLSTQELGAWVAWPQSGRIDADPYTRAHTVRLGLLPLNTSLAQTYHAATDADGRRLHSSCEYAIEVDRLDAQWWSLAVFDQSGALIPNAAQRYAYNAATVVRETDGGATLVLARDARPGNWLPTRGAGNLTLQLTVQDPRWAQQMLDDADKVRVLPEIRRQGCAQ
jgi:hypothetical protein